MGGAHEIPDLLLVSLAAGLLGLGERGRRPGRRSRAPARRAAARRADPGAAAERDRLVAAARDGRDRARLLAPIRADFLQEGVILRSGEHSFHVIDGCSGLRESRSSCSAAVIGGRAARARTAAAALLLAIAPGLGFALNAVRIAAIAASRNPEAYAGAQGDHTPQGLALLAAGAAALYGIGRALHGPVAHAGAARAAGDAADPVWGQAAIALAALSALSLALSPFPPRARPLAPRELAFPEARAGWTSEAISGDPYFLGPHPGMLYRRYLRSANPGLTDAIDVLIGMDDEEPLDASVLFSSKLRWPGPDWYLERQQRVPLWDLARDAELRDRRAQVAPERAVIYRWKIRDEGLARETARSLFALEQSPFRRAQKARERAPRVVRSARRAARDRERAPAARPLRQPVRRGLQRLVNGFAPAPGASPPLRRASRTRRSAGPLRGQAVGDSRAHAGEVAPAFARPATAPRAAPATPSGRGLACVGPPRARAAVRRLRSRSTRASARGSRPPRRGAPPRRVSSRHCGAQSRRVEE